MTSETTVRLELTFNPDEEDNLHPKRKKRIESDGLSNMTMWSKYSHEYQEELDRSIDTLSSVEDRSARKGSAALSESPIQEPETEKKETKETFKFPTFKFHRFRVPKLRWSRHKETAIHGELIEELSPENTLEREEENKGKKTIEMDTEGRPIQERRSSLDRIRRMGVRARRSITSVLTSLACFGGQRFEDDENTPYLSAKLERDLNPPRLEIIDLHMLNTVDNPNGTVVDTQDADDAKE